VDRGYGRSRQANRWSALKFSDKADLRLEPYAELLFDSVLSDRDELAYVPGGRASEIHHDIGMNVGDLRIAVSESLESALIDEPACSHSFDLLEYRAGAWMKLQPRMPGAAPAQVFLHDLVHCWSITALKLKSHRERNVATVCASGSGDCRATVTS